MIDAIVKYPGGKHRELPYILPNLPQKINNYYEPFVGGGSVFLAINSKVNKLFINDKSTDLMLLYEAIKKQDSKFFSKVRSMYTIWSAGSKYAQKLIGPFTKMFYQRISETNGSNESIEVKIINVIDDPFLGMFTNEKSIKNNVLSALNRKITYLIKQNNKGETITQQGIEDIVQTAVKSAIYTYFRGEFNSLDVSKGERAALYLFTRQYAYSSMFRFSKSGKFNVPYGGKSYNNISLSDKSLQYRDTSLINLLKRTTLDSLDFEEFLQRYKPQKDDFIFLDPPYDSTFSTYDQNRFDEREQRRLAQFMINNVQAHWMLIIKNTELISELYVDGTPCANGNNIHLNNFGKKYSVNFKNRNNRKTDHLIITNY